MHYPIAPPVSFYGVAVPVGNFEIFPRGHCYPFHCSLSLLHGWVCCGYVWCVCVWERGRVSERGACVREGGVCYREDEEDLERRRRGAARGERERERRRRGGERRRGGGLRRRYLRVTTCILQPALKSVYLIHSL